MLETPRRIMIVDDEESILALVREVLSGEDYIITTAPDLTSANRLLVETEQTGLDLLITDLTLPDGNGAEFAAQLLAKNPSLMVLLITGWTDALLSLSQELRSRAFLIEKPFSITELKRAVQAMLP